jgi:pimeloyl-ACP methyl ester carboxylesterase
MSPAVCSLIFRSWSATSSRHRLAQAVYSIRATFEQGGGAQRDADSARGTDFRPDLAALTVPTLVIHGGADEIAPIDITGKRTADLVADAKLVVYENASHGLFLTHKDRLNQEIIDFMSRT